MQYGGRIQLLLSRLRRNQHLSPTSWLSSGRTSGHQNRVSIFPGCLLYAVGKPPLINIGRSESYSISKKSCKSIHLNCEIKHNLNLMVCSIDLKYNELLQYKFLLFFYL